LDNLNEEHALRLPIISDILKGPIPRSNILVLLYESSAQWLSLILTIASELLRRDHVVGITTITTPPAQVRQRLAITLPNLKELETAKQLTLIDWYTWMTGKKSTEPRSVDSLGLAQFNIQDSRYQRDDSPLYDFLVSDNLSAFLKYNDERAFMQWLDKTMARMREFRGVRLYCFLKHFHSDAFYANLEAMADGVIELDIRERQKHLENVIRLRSMKGIQHPTDWRTLKITTSGLLELVSRHS
jgi:KaiC/GvpD/RAD55 family RecA-like ATPase